MFGPTLKPVSFFSSISEADFQQLKSIVENVPEVKFICLDVANGYSQFFVDFVKKVRDTLPSHTIMVRIEGQQLEHSGRAHAL